MNNPNFENKPIIAVSIALVLVLLLVIGLFAFGQPSMANTGIVLPEPQSELITDDTDIKHAPNSLLQVTSDNVSSALGSLEQPEHYHQTYLVSIGEGADAARYDVELWVSGSFCRAEIAYEQSTKVILSKKGEAYIWYASDERPIYLELNDDVTFEDILGLPAFDYLQTLRSRQITDAEYLVLEDKQQNLPCIFFSQREVHEATSRYWIDLTTGLLYMADCVEGNEQVYHVEQSTFDRLASGDESLENKFLLPNGERAFIE